MKKSAQQKIKKTGVKKSIKKSGFSWKNLFQFFLTIPVIILFFVITFDRAEAAAGINQTINFQGKIVNKTGQTNINDGTYSFTFKLYDASSGGNQLWTETQSSVTVTSGIFQVALGSVSSLSGVNFNQDNLWLDITFNGETFGSRIRLAAVPQAFNSQYLDGVVATQSASGFNLQGGTSNYSTVSFTTSGSTLTLQPGTSGGLTVQSNGANGLTIDTGGAATLSIGATANAITFGATNNPTYAFNGSGGVTFQGTSFTMGNGSTATFQTTGNAGLTFLPSGIGNIILGQSSGVGDIIVQPNGGGNAAFIVNKQGGLGLVNPNIFVASAAGVLKFSVDSGGNATAAGSLNVGQPTLGFANAVGNFAGNINNYMQVQVQNRSNGNSASSDFIATADNGTDTTNYIDFGINSSTYNQAAYNIGGADDGYLYTSNGALSIGTAAFKPLVFNTNGTTSTDEAMRIDGNGYISIGTQGATNANAQLIVNQTNTSGQGDIFTASASGNTKFTIANSGAITDVNYAGANAILYAAPTTGLVNTTTTTTGSQCLLSGSGSSGTPTWGGCGGASASLQTAYNVGQTIDFTGVSNTAGLTFGTANGTGNIVFQPNAGGQAAFIINKQSNAGDIFTASASGTTRFVISNGGNIGIGTKAPQQALTLGSSGTFATEMTIPTGSSATVQSGGTLPNATYFYVVTASDGTGETIQSAETTGCTSTNAGGGQHTCLVSWTGVSGAVSYKLYRTTTSGTYTGSAFLTSVTTTSYTDTGSVTLTAGVPPSATSAYINKFSNSGISWLSGGNFGIGTTSPLATLHVKGGASGGNAAVIFDQVGASTNDLFTASASGATKFQVTNGGALNLGGGQTSDIDTLSATSLKIGVSTTNALSLGNSGATFALTSNGGLNVTTGGGLSGVTAINSIQVSSSALTFGTSGTVSSFGSNSMTIDSGSTGPINIGTSSNGKTITIGNTSANTAVTINTGGAGLITLGGNTGVGNVLIQPNAGGQAGLIINKQTTTGDIFTASASGATKFQLTNGGSLNLVGGQTSDIDTLTATTLKIGVSTQNGLTIGRSGATTTINGSSFTLGAATGITGALTITSNGSTALTVGANGSTNPVFQVDASTGSVATGLKVLGAATGGTTAVSVIDSGTNANLSIDAKGSGTITIGGTSTGNIIIGGSANGLTFSTSTGPTYAGSGRPTKQIILSAEYPGAVLTASGSATINGSMTSDASPSANPTAYDWQNYYQWVAAADGALQDYTVAVRVTLPKDFSAWATGNCLTIAYNTGLASSTKNALEAYIYKDGDTSGIPVAFSIGNASAKSWTTVNFTSASFGGTKTWNTAGGVAVIYLKLRSANPVNYVQVGDITLNYLAAF